MTTRILLVGPTSAAWTSIAAEIEGELARLARPGVELTYRCTGAGPLAIRSNEDVRLAAPFVVQTVVEGSRDGFDAFIVDCTSDPGVADARRVVPVPVVGVGEALRAAIATAPRPVYELSGDELRSLDQEALISRVRGAATVAMRGTGFSHLVDVLTEADPTLLVLDPLDVALHACLEVLDNR